MVYLARSTEGFGNRRWHLFSKDRWMKSWVGESRKDFFKRWEEYFGEELPVVQRFRGVFNLEQMSTLVYKAQHPQVGEVN